MDSPQCRRGNARTDRAARDALALLLCASATLAAGCNRDEGGPVEAQTTSLSTVSVTQAGDEMRMGWYNNQPNLSPGVVGGSSFTQLFSRPIDGEVYAQPLVFANTLLVVTEKNNIYGIDPNSGAIRWERFLGTRQSAAELPCFDLYPNIGITGTPVIDQATGVAYFFSKRYVTGSSGEVGVYAHAVDVASGAEQPGFPVRITGSPQNDPSYTFSARTQSQRPGLLLLDGVIYAGFGSHCDINPWKGVIVGVSTAGAIRTMWTSGQPGIWQSGSGLVSDGPGQILFSTGNGGAVAGPTPGNTPSANLAHAVVRVGVQPDGTLRTTDFFSPYDAVGLDTWDADLGSAGPVGLPEAYFGTPQHPRLMVMAGKQGYVYLLDRDNLGGRGMGPGGSDAVINRIGPYGGVWSKAAVWPGEGGYLYMPTASTGMEGAGSRGYLRMYRYGLDGAGKPSLTLAGSSPDQFAWGSSLPIVTSNGTQPGSALVWIIWTPQLDQDGSQLRAYDAVPVNGVAQLRFSASVGRASRYTPPLPHNGRIYVGTRDGRLLAFGNTTEIPPLSGNGHHFGNVIVGQSSPHTLTVTASGSVTIASVTSTSSVFTVGQPTPAVPVALNAGGTLQIPVTFAPSAVGLTAGTIRVTTTAGGTLDLAVSGRGVSPNASLTATPMALSFGGTPPGGQLVSTVTFTNEGGAPLTINSVLAPDSPFFLGGAPSPGATLAAGAAITITVTFAPTAPASYSDSVGLDTTAGTVSIPITGLCSPPGSLIITPMNLDIGPTGVGATRTGQFTIHNSGGSTVTITKSKPPAAAPFSTTSSLPEGATIAAGGTVTLTVSFTPTAIGAAPTGTWIINGTDGAGERTVELNGTGVADLTASASAVIALVTNPLGGGSRNLQVIRNGIFPPVGSGDSQSQYDTYNGMVHPTDWMGYQFTQNQAFSQVVFQEGIQFYDGGWFSSVTVQVRQGGSWVNVPSPAVSPLYPGANGISFEKFTFSFPTMTGDAIRVHGTPGGTAGFISVGEIRVYGEPAGGVAPNVPPTANAGPNQTVASGAPVTLDGTGSTDADGDALTFAWSQTAGPAVTLSSATASGPTFNAPTVTAQTTLTFNLTVTDTAGASGSASVTITVAAPPPPPPPPMGGTDITASATSVIAFVPNPLGGGNRNIQIIRDGIFPAVNSQNSAQQFDTWNGITRSEDWIGYLFSGTQTFGSVVFQEGRQFGDGGWFSSGLRVQVRQSGAWVDVPGASVSPTYPGANGITYQTFTFGFPAFSGDGIRIIGTPGGSATFISVGELRVLTAASSGGNSAPTANAGPDRTAQSGQAAPVQLDGTGSIDPEGAPLTYQWTQTSGPTVTLSSATAAAPTFTPPTVAASTSLVFSLVVNDGSLASAPDTVTVTVSPAPPTNTAPTANAGPDQTVASGQAGVQLDGRGSSDPQGTAVTYQWSQTAGPTVTLSSTTSATPGFTAPTVAASTPLTFQLIVSDGSLSSAPDAVTVTVAPMPPTNTPPTANAGTDQSVASGQAGVQLDGRGSSDPQGTPVTYQWSQTAGTTVALSSTTSATPTFTAPTVTTNTVLTFRLIVSDGSLSSGADTVNVTVQAPPPPPPPPPAGTDITTSGTPIAFVPNPLGGGNRNISVIRDGIFPAVGSGNSQQQFDTWNGTARSEDWIGHSFATTRTFSRLVFQEGIQFWDGGWFVNPRIQVRQDGVWVNVPGATASPAYPGANGTSYETFTYTFPSITGDAIRIIGQAGGFATFISVGELRVFEP